MQNFLTGRSDVQVFFPRRFRRAAGRLIDERAGDGGVAHKHRIEQADPGSCVILILDSDTRAITGVQGA